MNSDDDVTAVPAHRTFVTLDGLRGIAAIAVVFAHLKVIATPIRFPSDYLAVDLFFIMSGFVLANAYERKLMLTMSPLQFMRLRVIRLYPLYILGTLATALGALVAIFGHVPVSWTSFNLFRVTFAALLFLPDPWRGPQGDRFYPLNIPAWSLFWELLANLLYALWVRRLSSRLLAGFVCLASMGLVTYIAITGKADAGLNWGSAGGGFFRVMFGFFMGVAIYRLWRARRLPKITVPPLALIVGSALIFAIDPGPWREPFGGAMILLVMPAIVAAAVQVEPVRGSRIYTLAGVASYPIYMIHYPLLRYILGVSSKIGHGNTAALAPWAGCASAVFLVALAIVLDRWFDRPIRAWLTGRLTTKRGPAIERIA